MDAVAIILLLGSINGIVIGFVLITLKNGKPLATRVFGTIVLLFSLIVAGELAQYLRIDRTWPHLISVFDGLVLIIGPLFLLYASLITERKRALHFADLLHLIPFLLFTVILMPYYSMSAEEKLQGFNYDPSGLISTTKGLFFFAYFVFSLVFLKSKPEACQIFPENNLRHIRWFRRLLITLLVVAAVNLTFEVLWSNDVQFRLDPDTISVILVSIVFYVNSVMLIRKPFILWSTSEFATSLDMLREAEEEQKVKYKTSPLSINDLQKNMKQLMEVMKTERLFTDPNLNPSHLEQHTGIKSYYISQTLSQVLNKNFSEFVNAYRVEEAKRLIRDRHHDHKTLLALGLEAGFNSKTSFNRIFKQHTGLSPTQFKAGKS